MNYRNGVSNARMINIDSFCLNYRSQIVIIVIVTFVCYFINSVLKTVYINLVIPFLNLTFPSSYGHGYEIFCVAYEPHSHILASACKVWVSYYYDVVFLAYR